MLIYNGLVGVESKGKEVAKLKDGNFIGEVSFITGGAATATVRALQPTRYIAWPKDAISQLLNRNPSMRLAMQSVLSTDFSKTEGSPNGGWIRESKVKQSSSSNDVLVECRDNSLFAGFRGGPKQSA